MSTKTDESEEYIEDDDNDDASNNDDWVRITEAHIVKDASIDRIRAAFAPTSASDNVAMDERNKHRVFVPALQRAYRDDPQEAIIDNIPPHQGAEDIRLWNSDGQRLDPLVEYHDKLNARQDTLWKNPDYVFDQYLKGFLQKKGGGAALSNMFDLNEVPYQLAPAPVAVQEPAPRPRPNAKTNPAPAPTIAPAGVGAFVVGAAPGVDADVMDTGAARLRELDYKKTVDAAMDTMGVTGMGILTNAQLAGISAALADLRATNARKFDRATKTSFLRDSSALEDFAQLVAYEITLAEGMIGTGTYLKQVDLPRRKNAVLQQCRAMDKTYLPVERTERTQGCNDSGAVVYYMKMNIEDRVRNMQERAREIRAARSGRMYRVGGRRY
jgi:hypothetical protein